MTLVWHIGLRGGRAWRHFGVGCGSVAVVVVLGAAQAFAQCAVDEMLVQQVKLTDPFAHTDDHFGFRVSVSGDTAVVTVRDGCPTGGGRCGAVYAYRLNGTVVIDEQKLTAFDKQKFDNFGSSVFMSGDTALVGADGDGCAAGGACGSAYMFRFQGPFLALEQKLTASDAGKGDFFGFSVSVSGDTAVVGAFRDECAAGPDCGSAYVFRYDGTAWIEEQKLTASDARANDWFGWSVSVSGDTAMVGARHTACAAGDGCGAVYVYRFDGTNWVQAQKLTASDGTALDGFGVSVSMSGDAALVGAFLHDCSAGLDCGAAYLFRFNGTSWVEEQQLTASDAFEVDRFGVSVSVSGNTAVVGALGDHCAPGLRDCGSAYVFGFNGMSWVQNQKLTASDRKAFDRFGVSVSVSGETAVVGAFRDDCAGGLACGSAYVFGCGPGNNCADSIGFIEPKPGNVDARQPHEPQSPSARMGIDTITVHGTPGTDALDCWSLCETDDGGSPNAITSIDDNGDETYTLHLARPMTTWAVTTLSATLGGGSVVSGQYMSHPGNVDGDMFVSANDLSLLLGVLSGVVSPPDGIQSMDIDRSGQVAPADVLRLIDMFNAADGYDPWLGTVSPDCGLCCSP